MAKHLNINDMIQDKEGGGVTKRRPKGSSTQNHQYVIRKPPVMEAPPGNGHTAMAVGQDLVTLLMEENSGLKGQVESLQGQVSEATKANEQWFKYNAKTESQIVQLKETVIKLKDELTAEKEQHTQTRAELEKVQAIEEDNITDQMEESSKLQELEERNKFLEEDSSLLRDQLAYIQRQLRKMEMCQQLGESPDWACQRCTLINPGDSGKCVVCGMKAPDRFHGGPSHLEWD